MAPFKYDAPSSPYGATIAEILAHQNDAQARSSEMTAQLQAQAAGQSARAWGGALSNIGQTLGEYFDPVRRQTVQLRAQEQQLRAQQLGMENQLQQAKLGELDRSRQARTAIASAIAKTPRNPDGTYNTDAILQNVSPEYLGDVEPHLAVLQKFNASASQEHQRKQQETIQAAGQLLRAKAWDNPIAMDAFVSTLENNALITKDEGHAYRVKLLEDPANGQQLLSRFVAPGKIEDVAPGHKLVQDGKVVFDNQQPDETVVVNGQLVSKRTGQRIGDAIPPQETPGQEETARHNKELERIATLTAGRSEAAAVEIARHNRAMEESARNRVQARPMTSGDAGRITDLDTALNQLSVLRDDIGSTGAASKVGAMLPNAVTEYTGLGASAKSRQAQIDRVKQLIGKTLEGGVLRKEDEIKYEKILPTIGDPPDVAKAKMDGLERMIRDKRETTLQNLGDAGFNVDAMTQRGGPSRVPVAAPKADPLGLFK